MSVQSVLIRSRAAARARMYSRVRAMRDTGVVVQDEETGAENAVWEVIYTDLPFRLDDSGGLINPYRTVRMATGDKQIGRRVGHVPHDTANLRDGDLLDITVGENAGGVWRVVEVDWSDQKSARRLALEAHERPSEWA